MHTQSMNNFFGIDVAEHLWNILFTCLGLHIAANLFISKFNTTHWSTFHFGIQWLFPWLFPTSYLPLTIAMDAALYISLTIFSKRKDNLEYFHHVMWACILPSFLATNTSPMIADGLGWILFTNSRGVLALLLLPKKLRGLAFAYLAVLRLVWHPFYWYTTYSIWLSWHHACHAFAICFAIVTAVSELGHVGTGVIHGSARDWLFRLVGCISGQRVRILSVHDVKIGNAARVLKQGTKKGQMLEALHSLHMWAPLISVESIDGDQYTRMIEATRHVMKSTQMSLRVQTITKTIAAELVLMKQHGQAIQHADIQRAVARVMHGLVFETKNACDEDIERWCQIATVLAGRIAAKTLRTAHDDMKIRAAMTRAEELARETSWYGVVIEMLPVFEERVSCFLQPLLLSPVINLCDGLVATWDAVEKQQLWTGINHKFIISVLSKHPPFPILERLIPADGVHYVINSDEIATKMCPIQPSWLAFSLGPRQCLGQSIALHIIDILLKQWLLPVFMQGIPLRLSEGYLLSGRHNDKRTTSLHVQGKVVIGVLWRALQQRWLVKND